MVAASDREWSVCHTFTEPDGFRWHLPGCWACVNSGLEFCTPNCYCPKRRAKGRDWAGDMDAHVAALEERIEQLERRLESAQ